jgi:hypothetical protein
VDDETLRKWVGHLLNDAYRFGDKPHRLFYTIKEMAALFKPNEQHREEITRLMQLEAARDRSTDERPVIPPLKKYLRRHD